MHLINICIAQSYSVSNKSSKMSFKDKVVLITGAGGGIGSATAIHFSGLQANLILVDINRSSLEETAKRCHTKTYSIVADLSKEEDVRRVFKEAMEQFSRLDVLINNAGISSKHNIHKENFLENFDLTFNVNLKAPMLLTHLAVPHLIAAKGNVINITSVGGIHPLPDLLIYNASKAALRQFSKSIAIELGPKGVRVNSVAPAAVKTQMVRSIGVTDVEEFEKRRAMQLPLRKMIECEEVAEMISYLASDKARSVTGAEFVIDAGHLLGGGVPRYSDD